MSITNVPAFDPAKNPLAPKVIAYGEAFQAAVAKARTGGGKPDWSDFKALIDTDTFRRVGVYKEEMTWPIYEGFLNEYAMMSSWEGVFRRVTEVPGLVILELEEHNTIAGHTDVSNTVTIYRFNAAGKVDHLDVYLQSAAINPAAGGTQV
jgi:hypothetical protein